MTDRSRADAGRGVDDDVLDALLRLARGDFSVRLTSGDDPADDVARSVNVIAEELDRLSNERDQQRGELQSGMAQLTEAFVSIASGNFAARATRSGAGDPLDVLAYLLNNTAVEVGDAFAEIDRQRAVLEVILDSIVDGVLLLDTERHVRRANRAAARLFGWTQAGEMVGLPFTELVAPRDHALAVELLEAASRSPVRDREVLFLTRARELLGLSVNAAPVGVDGGGPEGVVLVARDDRELKSAQAQLQISDRLATMGTLAAGVAHEVNNPLAFVTSNIDYITDLLERTRGGALDADDYHDVMKALRASQSGAERVRLIVRDLRAFSRIEQDAIGRLDVCRLLDSAASMIRNELRHHATLVKEYNAVPHVDANEPRLVQVFLNLIQNAVHAIPAGNAAHDRIRLVTRTGPSGEAVVEVHDTGTGIAHEILPHIFDAFFTTKVAGVGTGLGLAICQKIVTSFGGRIEVETALGAGSTFRVLLPASRARDDVEATPRKLTLPPPRASARRRVLVVDDEPEVGEAFARFLGAAHDVVTTTSGSRALQLVSESVFDVVFCDLMMPEMTGMDFFRRLLKEMPDVAARVVFMSGGTFGSGVEEFLAGVDNERVEKPFDQARVLRLVESA